MTQNDPFKDPTHIETNQSHEKIEATNHTISKSRLSKKSFCTVSSITLVFILLIGFLVVFPVIQLIIKKFNTTQLPPNYSKFRKNRLGPIKPSRPLKMIDPDTPNKAKKYKATTGQFFHLTFSDEFNRDGRMFFPGDDPAWEAVDLWYEPTGDLEYYSPEQITTKNGNLVITLEEKSVGDFKYKSGMLQSWNKVCFQGGYMEVRVSLPGSSHIPGFWPAVWTLGNLGRAGYKATTEGTWPYSYDTCDGAVQKNQGMDNISELKGQRLNKCVCEGEDHPNPGVGRGSPEIDLLEPTAHKQIGGEVSQSFQLAPFDFGLQVNLSGIKIEGLKTRLNDYKGSKLQQAISGITNLNSSTYSGKGYEVFGMEYEPGNEGYITWFVGGKKTFSIQAKAIGANPKSKTSQRLIPEEPMSMIFNLAISETFTKVDYDNIQLPGEFLIDYVRVYQHPNQIKMSCDPPSHPTKQYIKNHKQAYYNKSCFTWESAGYKIPEYNINNKC